MGAEAPEQLLKGLTRALAPRLTCPLCLLCSCPPDPSQTPICHQHPGHPESPAGRVGECQGRLPGAACAGGCRLSRTLSLLGRRHAAQLHAAPAAADHAPGALPRALPARCRLPRHRPPHQGGHRRQRRCRRGASWGGGEQPSPSPRLNPNPSVPSAALATLKPQAGLIVPQTVPSAQPNAAVSPLPPLPVCPAPTPPPPLCNQLLPPPCTGCWGGHGAGRARRHDPRDHPEGNWPFPLRRWRFPLHRRSPRGRLFPSPPPWHRLSVLLQLQDKATVLTTERKKVSGLVSAPPPPCPALEEAGSFEPFSLCREAKRSQRSW